MDEAHEKAQEHLKTAQKRQKDHYDRFVAGEEIMVGDHMCLYVPVIKTGKKLHSPWQGQHVMVKTISDNLNAELFKADPELAAPIMTSLFTKIWEQEEIPIDWSRGLIVKISKKWSLSDCNNWQGITLLSVPSKIFCKIIIQCIT